MKVETFETEKRIWINLFPETLEEAGLLLRLGNNAKAERPIIFTAFHHGDEIKTEFEFRKRDKLKNYVEPYKPIV